jgi:F420H(2)-dependent quinone reductase
VTTTGFANRAVATVLRSPFHALLSRKIELISYRGRRSGTQFDTPTQYVELDDDVVAMMVGEPTGKEWWKNFREPWPIELLVRGTWHHRTAQAHWRHDEPSRVAVALERFRQKYGPRHVPGDADDALVVLCEPT